MKAKQKQLIAAILGAVVLGFLVWVLVFSNITVTETTGAFIERQHNWTNAFVDNIQTNHIFYLLTLAVLLVGGYFLLPRKRRK